MRFSLDIGFHNFGLKVLVNPWLNCNTMWTECIWWNLCLKFGFLWHNGRDGGWKRLMQGSLLYDNITGCVARPAVGCWLVKKISTLIGYLLTDGLNYLTVKYLAGWHFEKRAAVLKLISFPVYLVCYALHYGIMYVSIHKILPLQPKSKTHDSEFHILAIKLKITVYNDIDTKRNEYALTGLQRAIWPSIFQSTNQPVLTS